ncbi:hypothetical protein JCM19232_4676 [Vibrio ishigakensis]|uniref:Uncharacterized protein n=1 Tax=Vibrio ishigakensis TaxID=1481914 RepID=A0A0B8QLJ8_9VIBR|nr:hypothetical protein JCM19232_4676 [Vibrio ishigakensis]GAM68240.1 hypothetical protein JCM19236_220 [Vibrio sp. JCM 19236]GAM75344.1 hypothetical protein JCM19241_3256 [Vibrio ishigakensis]
MQRPEPQIETNKSAEIIEQQILVRNGNECNDLGFKFR